jgi:hypothetical protein
MDSGEGCCVYTMSIMVCIHKLVFVYTEGYGTVVVYTRELDCSASGVYAACLGVHTRASGVYTQWTPVWAVVYTPCRSWCVYTDWSLYTGKQLWCIHVSWVAPRVVYTRLV